MIRQYLSNIINDHEDEWKNLVSSKYSKVTRFMCINSDNIDIMIGYETDEIIEKPFKSLLQRYQKVLEESMRGNEYVYDSVYLLYHRLHKISLNRGRSYIDSPEWLKNKRATINPKNSDVQCFQYCGIKLSKL